MGLFVWLIMLPYPLLGHDTFFAFPRLLLGVWHFHAQGLLPFRYVPQVCGGLPLYGNPQDMFYSLPQMFVIAGMDLLQSMMLTIVVMMIVGYIGWMRVGRDLLSLNPAWSHTFAIVILSNGFFLLHMIMGHLTFHTMPLLGWALWLLFREKRGLSPFPRLGTVHFFLVRDACLFGLLFAVMLYSGGVFVVMNVVLAALLLLPIVLLLPQKTSEVLVLKPLRSFARVLPRLLACGLAALLLSLSRLVAVWSFMRFFPRTVPFQTLPTEASTPGFLAKIFFAIPQTSALFPADLYPARIHEYSMLVSPLIIVGLLCALFVSIRRVRTATWWRVTGLAAYGALLLLFFLNLARGDGILADVLQHSPLFSSIRIPQRFLYLFALLLSAIGIWGLEKGVRSLFPRKKAPDPFFAPLIVSLLTLLAFTAAYRPLMNPTDLELTLPYPDVLENLAVSRGFERRPVTLVEDMSAYDLSDFHYVFAGTTGFSCYEPVLANGVPLPPLQEGPVELTQNGSYNLRNPACLQYPEQNACTPGDFIKNTDTQNLRRFIRGKSVTWKLSPLQRIADVVTLLSLVAAIVIVLLLFIQWLYGRQAESNR